MAEIRHRVGIDAPQSQVFEAVGTTEGLARWWTCDVDGGTDVGERLRFFFGAPEPAAVMEVVDRSPDDRVGWRCVEGPGEWVGTELTFDLRSADGETALLFTHGGWPEGTALLPHCSTKWAYFLLGMKSQLEGGTSIAYPNDVPVSRWG